MKLLNLDSSLTARKALAQELHYTGDMNDSATMNIWLHKQVMRKLAENGGNVPADLMDCMATYLGALLGCSADGWCRTIRTIRCGPRSHCLRRCFSHRLGSLQHCSGLDAARHKQLRSDRPGLPKQIEPKHRSLMADTARNAP